MAGLLARMFGRGKREERLSGFYSGPLALSGSGPISAARAEALSTVCACVSLISNAIASLPCELVQDTANGTVDAPPTVPAWRVLQRPNRWQSWPAFAGWLTAQYLLHGNGVARIGSDGRGAANSVTPIPWQWLLPEATGGAEPRLSYQVMQTGPDAGLLGLPTIGGRLLDSEVLHVRNRSDFGLIGRSVLSRATEPLHEGLEIQTVATANWRNGMRPSAVLKAPAYLSDAQRERFNDSWLEKFTGSLNSGRVPLLEGSWSLERAALSSVDAQFREMRDFSTDEICRLFAVPTELLRPSHAITNLSEFTAAFAQQCLLPIVASVEAEFDYSVLPSGLHLRLSLDGLLRGNFAQATSAINALVQSGVLSPNEGRQSLGWSEHDDPEADMLRVGVPPAWPPDAANLPSVAPKPGPRSPDGLPAPGTNQNQGSSRGNGKAVLQ